MDRYFNRRVQKSEHEFTKLGPAVCLLGRSGIGKTWAAHQAFQPHVELTAEILRSRQSTVEFLLKIQGTSTHVILDEYETVSDLVGIGDITKPPTNGIFCVISQVPVKFQFEIKTYDFPVPDHDTIRRIAPGITDENLARSKGDLRFAIRSLNFKGDAQDDFMGPRDFVTDLVSRYSNTRPVDHLSDQIQEPGNISSILHENYVDSKNCDYAKTASIFSEADVFESRVYAGDWGLYSCYTIFGCIMPAVEIGHSLRPPLRPGSTWTKYQNACMRAKRIQAMSRRLPGKQLSLDELYLLREYAERGEVGPLKEYGLVPQDIDTLNHLSPLRKMKAKNLAALKKSLQ
jgi:hypothetical protein